MRSAGHGVGCEPHFGLAAEAELRGTGAVVTVKSATFESVSVMPPLLRTAAVVFASAATAVPSAQLAVPYETLSTRVPATSLPHTTFRVAALKRPTFPFVALALMFVVTKSAVTGRSAPPVPAVPQATRMYLQGSMIVPFGKVKRLVAPLAQLPVAEP